VDGTSADRVAPLAGLRFAAALGIVLFHYGGPLVEGGPAWLERVRTGGHVWVGLFYVLSGFVLARAHPAPMGPSERRAFWVARGARLYPAYLLAFLLSAPFVLERWSGGGPLGTLKALIVGTAALLLAQAWITPLARIWNTPGWSTSVVMAFYALFPFAAAALSRLGRRGLALALGGAWALSLVFPLLWLGLQPDGVVADLTWNEPVWLEALKFHPVARAGEFLAGVALGLLHRRGVVIARGGTAVALAGLGGAVLLLAWDPLPYVLLHNGVLVPLFALAILGLAARPGLAARALGSPAAQRLGDASFALYALQEPLWRIARATTGAAAAEPSAAFVVAYVLVAVGVSLAVARLLERPARRALRAWFGGTRGAEAAAPARRQAAG
jgi:peptidoglycan/LPS O-acetylase OafA/YrhL